MISILRQGPLWELETKGAWIQVVNVKLIFSLLECTYNEMNKLFWVQTLTILKNRVAVAEAPTAHIVKRPLFKNRITKVHFSFSAPKKDKSALFWIQ